MKGKLWSREELILSLNLYFKLENEKIQSKSSEIRTLAQITGRSSNSIGLRLANFASCDPQLKERGIKGLDGGLNQCQPIWDEFNNKKDLLNLECEKIILNMNITKSSSIIMKKEVKVIDTKLIWKKILDCLNELYNFDIQYFGKNPYHLSISNSHYYIFIRNLTKAYSNRSTDVCRIQLPKNAKFDYIKNSNISLIVLGYCYDYNTFATWPSKYIKPRLNEKGNVSLYSRYSAQTPPAKGKKKRLKLNNGEVVTIFNLEDIGLLFNEPISSKKYYPIINEGLFAPLNVKEKMQKKLYLSSIKGKELISLLEPHLSDTSELKAIQVCISYFEQNKMNYDLLTIKNIISKCKANVLSKNKI
jgi:hypothetical protein